MKWIVIAGIVIAGAGALLVLASDGESQSPERADRAADEGPGSSSRARPGDSARVAPNPPKRFSGSGAEAEVAPKAIDEFLAQDTDTGWAVGQAETVGDIAAELVGDSAVSVTEVECRTTLCRLVVKSSDQAAFMRVIEKMQSPQGYVGVAESLLLTGLSKADGTQQVSVVLEFSR